MHSKSVLLHNNEATLFLVPNKNETFWFAISKKKIVPKKLWNRSSLKHHILSKTWDSMHWKSAPLTPPLHNNLYKPICRDLLSSQEIIMSLKRLALWKTIHSSNVLTEYQLDQLVEVAHKDCCWGPLTCWGHTGLIPRNDHEGCQLMIHTLINFCYNDLPFPHPLDFLPLEDWIDVKTDLWNRLYW